MPESNIGLPKEKACFPGLNYHIPEAIRGLPSTWTELSSTGKGFSEVVSHQNNMNSYPVSPILVHSVSFEAPSVSQYVQVSEVNMNFSNVQNSLDLAFSTLNNPGVVNSISMLSLMKSNTFMILFNVIHWLYVHRSGYISVKFIPNSRRLWWDWF